MKLECIATSLADAKAIEASGGNRIELVSGLSDGGFTPSDGLVRAVQAAVKIPVAVMLRPNRRHFVYSDDDLVEMRRDALRFHELGVRRVVTGMLDEDGIADIERLEAILAGTEYHVTFHRAIDETTDIGASLDRINLCPRITHVLTSLGPGRVADHLDRLRDYAEHSRPRLILGSGITLNNAVELAEAGRSYQCDLHVGTALRHGDPMAPVDGEAVRALAEQLKDYMYE